MDAKESQFDVGGWGIPGELQRTTAYADAFALLAIAVQFPREELFDGLCDRSMVSDALAIVREGAFDLPGSKEVAAASEAISLLWQASAACDGGTVTLEELRREYTRLFNHPEHPEVYLYEGQFLWNEGIDGTPSSWRERPRLFVNPAALDAERCYRKMGMGHAEGVNVPADSMYTEMEFMSHLCAERAGSVLREDDARTAAIDGQIVEFKRIHLDAWMRDFFEACFERSRLDFYRAVGLFGVMVFEGLGTHEEASRGSREEAFLDMRGQETLRSVEEESG